MLCIVCYYMMCVVMCVICGHSYVFVSVFVFDIYIYIYSGQRKTSRHENLGAVLVGSENTFLESIPIPRTFPSF